MIYEIIGFVGTFLGVPAIINVMVIMGTSSTKRNKGRK